MRSCKTCQRLHFGEKTVGKNVLTLKVGTLLSPRVSSPLHPWIKFEFLYCSRCNERNSQQRATAITVRACHFTQTEGTPVDVKQNDSHTEITSVD